MTEIIQKISLFLGFGRYGMFSGFAKRKGRRDERNNDRVTISEEARRRLADRPEQGDENSERV